MQTYHTQHSPLGAFASFTIGLPQAPGGFGQSLGGPAKQNVFAGFRHGPEGKWRLLPFLTPPKGSAETAFTGEPIGDESAADSTPSLLPATEVRRTLGWASDSWQQGDFRFALFSPFGPTPDPALASEAEGRFAFAPVVCAEISYDNFTSDTSVELVFGLSEPAQPPRPLTDSSDALAGFATGAAAGYATLPSPEVSLRQGFRVFSPRYADHRGLHLLGGETALLFTVPPRTHRRFPIVLGFYQGGPVTTGLETRFWYTRLFRSLEEVLLHGLAEHGRYRALAEERDRELRESRLTPDQQWLLAQATHSYLGSSELLAHKNRPLWVVNEGEYRMINTFDLTVDHLFFELRFFPWAVRNVLDQFAERYAYRDRHGVSFTHDMGVVDQFTPPGYSSYECRDLHGCFSQMTMEQLLNWVCCAATYAEKTGDLAWLKRRKRLLGECADSLRTRDAEHPRERDGLLKRDSDRCGAGAEITTYDSLDVSLGQARNNLYLGVKTLAAWLLLERAFGQLDSAGAARKAAASAALVAATLEKRFEEETGFFPAVFEAGNRSRILPAIEGLVFPLYLGFHDDVRARFPRLFSRLERHLAQSLVRGVCLDAESGGWKISSTSTNTWMSKLFLVQHVARRLFPRAVSEEARQGDAAHVTWQTSPACGRFAFVDQVRSTDGRDLGSRYYPRGVTALLWLDET